MSETATPFVALHQKLICAPCGQGCVAGGVAMARCMMMRLNGPPEPSPVEQTEER